jgi:serine/threonine-protein kinase
MQLLRLCRIACLPLALVLASCAGGSAPSAATAGAKAANPGSPGAIAAAGVVPASFTFVIPLPSSHGATRSRKPQYLPATAQSLEIALVLVNGSAPSPTPSPTISTVGSTAPGCTARAGSTYTCTVVLGLPIGSDEVLVKAFAAPNATGNLLSQQQSTFTVVQGSANSFSMTLDANPGPIVLFQSGSACSGSPITNCTVGSSALSFTVTIADSHGTALANSTIPGSPVLSVASSNTATASVSATQSPFYGISLTPVASGTATITLTASPATGTSGLASTTFSFTVTIPGVITLAGSTTAGYANGTGTAATFNGPQGVASNAVGQLYVADTDNYEIRMITSLGAVTTLAGSGASGDANGPGTNASFEYPGRVAVDANGNVYVADYGNNQIREVTPTGVVTTLASGFSEPNGVAVDTAGNVYVADEGHNEIRMIAPPRGTVTTLAGNRNTAPGSVNGTGTDASFNAPIGVAVDATGNVYVADYGNNEIRKIAPGGTVTTLAGSMTRGSVNGTGTGASFNSPFDVAVDAAGNVYVADSGNNEIRMVTAAGVVTTLAGSWPGHAGHADGSLTTATFNFPTGVAVDAVGNVYVADQANNEIRKITP